MNNLDFKGTYSDLYRVCEYLRVNHPENFKKMIKVYLLFASGEMLDFIIDSGPGDSLETIEIISILLANDLIFQED